MDDYYEDLNGLLKIIKSEIGEDYPAFKRKHDLKLEIYRLQCVLLSPYLSKNMFNSLLSKLLELEKEYNELEKEYFEFEEGDYSMFVEEEKSEMRRKYKIKKCYNCGGLFHKTFLGHGLCVDCFSN